MVYIVDIFNGNTNGSYCSYCYNVDIKWFILWIHGLNPF